jgi:hypothetical protein
MISAPEKVLARVKISLARFCKVLVNVNNCKLKL